MDLDEQRRASQRAPEVLLARGREAWLRESWDDAFSSFSGADSLAPLEAADLERFAWCAALTGRDEEFLGAQERLHHLRAERGETTLAARSAFWIGFRLAYLGEMGRAAGWLGRAERLVEGEECVEQGYLLLPRVHRCLAAGDHESATQTASRAAEIGERFHDPDLTGLAQNLQGQALVRQQKTAEGLELLDEVMVRAGWGEYSPLVTGIIYCSVLDCCRRAYELNRAREWTRVLSKWCEAQPQLSAFNGECRLHRAEILELGGSWDESFAEAQRAAEHAARQTAERTLLGSAQYQRAEIHRLRGEFAAAEEAYRGASRCGVEPQPGLGLLRLAQGNGEAAASSIRRVLEECRDPLQRVRFLPAFVEAMLATGAVEAAGEAARELEATAAIQGSKILRAIADRAVGSVRLAEGDAHGALEKLRAAFAVWQELDAPYIAASIRVLMGRACGALGDEDGARLERDAAREVFAALGASPALARLEEEGALVEASSAASSAAPRTASPTGSPTASTAPSTASPTASSAGNAPTSRRRAGQEAGAGPRDRAAGPHGLSAREMEVLLLLAKGMTNKAIAQRLFLSEKTIDRHVSSIFNKLDVPSRAAATAFAYEHGLV